jgi:ABC-type nitrate/sulfonate/bicarbonate transport system substrate-binding protein
MEEHMFSVKKTSRLLAVAAAATLASATLAACGSDSDGANGSLKEIKMGVLPYLDYHAFYVADEMGFDEELGYDLSFTQYPLEPNETKSLVRKDIDVAQGAIGSLVPQLPSQPNLRVFLSLSQYKGFAFVVRDDDDFTTYEEHLDELGDPVAAREAVVEEMKDKELITTASSYKATVAGLMNEGGADIEDLNVLDFQEAAQGAAAFIRGEGDIYLGAVAQTVKLVEQMEGYEVLIQNEAMGAPGLWYSNAYVTDEYLQDNRDELVDLTAIWYRTMEYMRQDPDAAYETVLKTLNPATASNLTVDDLKNQIPDTTFFPTAEEAAELTYADDSEGNWSAVTDYQFEQASKLGTDLGEVTPEEFIVQESIFDEFMKNQKLQKYVHADF